MKSNVIAAVAGGLVLGGAIFLPMGANAINQELKQVAATQEKVASSVDEKSNDINENAPSPVQSAGVASVATAEETLAADPTATPAPTPLAGPTFSASDDDESDDVNADDSDDGNETESDD